MTTFNAGSGNVNTTINGTTSADIIITPSYDFNGTIDNISVKKIISPGVYGPELVTNGGFNGGANGWLMEGEGGDYLPEGWEYHGENGGTLPAYNPSISSALSRIDQGLSFPKFIFGGQGGVNEDEYALFKKTTTYGTHIWRSEVYNIGKDFDVMKIRFPVIPGVSGNMEILPVLRFDNESLTSVGTTINTTNYPNEENHITLQASNFDNGVRGKNNFYLEFQITGSDLAVIGLPINIDLEVADL